MREPLTRREALDHLLIIRETSYDLLNQFYAKRSEINEDIKNTKDLLDQVEAEIRRLIEI